MSSQIPGLHDNPRSALRRLALGVAATFVVLGVLVSCVGEPTAPRDAGIRYASGLRFNAVFPAMLQQASAADLIAFDRVHVVLHHSDGSLALDTTIVFPVGVDQVTLDLSVRLLAATPATGEVMTLDMAYLNSANEVVFRGGPAQITALPDLPGQAPPAPITIPVVYAGAGAAATGVRIAPRSLSVNAGGAFAFTAIAVDATGTQVQNTPIFWSSLDPTRATLGSATAGNGTALGIRGTARIVAALVTGKADTVTVDVQPVASSIALVSGNGQSGKVGKPTLTTLAQSLVVKVLATDGLPAAGVSVAFAVGSGGGSVSPASATTDANGLAQTSWTLGNTAGTQTVTATSGSLSGSPVSFTATGVTSSATKLVITSSPAGGTNISAGATLPFAVAAQDVDGDPVASFTGNVTLALTAGPAGAVLGGTTTAAASAGVATFSNITLGTPGTGYVVTASATGLIGASAPAFNIVTGPATNMVLVSGGGQTAAAGSAVTPITVALTDASGNAKANVPVDFTVTTGGGSVTPATVSTDAGGRASATWTLGASAGTQTLSVGSTGVTPLTVSATATSSASHWSFTQQPGSSQTAGVTFSPAVVAELRNATNAVVSTYNGPATLSISGNSGGAFVGGTATVTAVNGVATFSNVHIDQFGAIYQLDVSATGTSPGTSSTFTVFAAAANAISLASGGNQTGNFSAQLAQPIVAKVTDAFGNPVSGRLVTFAVASGGGSVTPASATTNAGGTASTQWTLGASGIQSMTITATGLNGSPIIVSATGGTGPGPLASTLVTPHLDTLTSIGDTRTLIAQGFDASSNVVAGSWTWVSRSPSIASVNSSGVVTALVNGSAWIVATDNSTTATKDSALIVVQQRSASINVSPSSRSIYQGATFAFTAQAVDGRGVPIAVQPTITWSAPTPSILSVNASGVATGVSIGSAQVRATAGAAVGVANIAVLSQITRIDVSFDSTNAPAPDNFTMTALGQQRMYRAVARDTLLAPMTGITFNWTSSNASVAAIDSTTPTKARATAAANGITTIQASAQGVTGGATLTVAQVLASIELTPPTSTVGITGTTSMLARGKDSNGRYISGGSFAFNSSAPSVATINASTGVVTGVTIGSTNITATSGSITSNTAVVSVNNSGPAVISFGRDTLGIGRGSATSVPIFLSKPSASAVVINLAVADTFAFWSTANVTVPAGQTSVNATLNGHNAGTTRIFALDGGTTGYAGDTAVLAVQANLRMTTTSYGLNATDQISTQALLSDPSPAGGTFVTFSFTNSGIAQISPDPAFIPAGQLAADIVIRGLAGGSTNVTPSATGVTGTAANIQVAAAVLTLNPASTRLGGGQYDQFTSYVQVVYTQRTPITVALTSTDTSVATVPPTASLPGYGSNYDYYQIRARNPGLARIIGTSAGWRPDTTVVTVTTPRVVISGGGTRNVTSPASSIQVYAADSARSTHYRSSSLAVRLSSSDTTVMRVIDTLVTIPADGQSISAQVIPGGTGGTAWIRTSASGHLPDSVQFNVVGPALTLNYTTNRIGLGQEQSVTLSIPNAIAAPLTVTLVSSDSTIVGTPQTVTVPQGSASASFTLRGKAFGSANVVATASGYAPDTGTTIITTPRLRLNGGTSITAYQQTSTNVSTRDSVLTTHNRTTPLTVTLTSTDTTVLKVDTLVTIAAGTSSASVVPVVTAVSAGTAKIIASAPGHLPDTNTWTVLPAKLQMNWSTFFIGARQHRDVNDFYVQTPTTRTVPVTVTLTQKNSAVVQLSATTLTLPANQSYQYFTFAGLLPGRDTVIASAPGYAPDTGFIIVTTPKLRASNLPSTAATTNPPASINVFVTDTTSNNTHEASDTVVVHAVSSDSTVIRPATPYFRILKNTQYTNTSVIYTGPGTATITYSDSSSGYLPTTTNAVTVTGPSLSISGSNPGSLGMRQRTTPTEYYVALPNSVTSPLTVNLVSTDPRVATVPATVTIPANSSGTYFTITAQDTLGTIQIQATATGYTATSVNIQVTAPQFRLQTPTTLNTTSAPTYIYVFAYDALGRNHVTAEDVVVTLASSAPGVATIDSTTVTIPQGSYYSVAPYWSPHNPGTAQLSASDARAAFYKYQTGTQNVTVQIPTPSLYFNGLTLGLGQYSTENVYLPDVTTSALTVPITHAAAPRTSTVSSVVIPASNSTVAFRITGTSIGSDTITVSPSGFNPAKAAVIVGLGRFTDYSTIPTSLRVGDSVLVTLYILDPAQNQRSVAAATTLTLTPNANIQFVSGGSTSTAITSVVVPADGYYVQVYLKAVSAGAASVSVSNANYSTFTNTNLTVTP